MTGNRAGSAERDRPCRLLCTRDVFSLPIKANCDMISWRWYFVAGGLRWLDGHCRRGRRKAWMRMDHERNLPFSDFFTYLAIVFIVGSRYHRCLHFGVRLGKESKGRFQKVWSLVGECLLINTRASGVEGKPDHGCSCVCVRIPR